MKSIPLRDYMKQHPDGISSNNAAAMLLPVALQLRDMHNNGLTHLEVSPDSIFVGESGAFLNTATTVETNRYTNGYAAPEIYKGLSAGNLSDIYSFCAVLSFVASGKHPMNALSRTETQKGEVIHQDVEWLELIQKGMSLDFSNRFSTMQEVIIKLSPYNVRPFIGTELREEQGAPKQHEKQRTKLSRKIMVISAVGVLVAMIVGTYIGCYCAARTKAKNGDFDAANDLLFAQELTKLHDAKLVSYIEAGQLLSMRNYKDAKVVFEELSGYLDADDLVKEADYRFAIQCADANDFTNAVTIMEYLSKIAYKDSSDKLLDIQYRSGVYLLQEKSDFKAASKIFSQLANKGYDGAEEMENQTQYLWAFDLVEREYYTDAYRKFMSIRNYEDVDECIDALSELMYLEGQNLYNKSDFSKARELFSCISSYRDSKKYITLMDNQGVLALLHPESAVKELVSIFYFENAAQLLLSRDDIAEEFLRGTWKGDGYYFTMDEEGGISYSLPWINYGDYYKISEGIVLLYPRNKEYDTKKLFFIEALSPDCIEVYCYKNNRTYTLYRE